MRFLCTARTLSALAFWLAVANVGCGAGGSPGSAQSSPGTGTPTAAPPPTPSAPAPAASPAPTPDVVARWTRSGPDGGEVNVVTIAPDDPSVVYAGTRGGLFRSGNGGASWQASDQLAYPNGLVPAVSDVVVDPDDTARVYAMSGFAIWRSTDHGSTWTLLVDDLPRDASNRQGAHAIALDPGAPEVTYVAGTSGGIFKSSDDGATWQQLVNGPPELEHRVSAIGVDPRDPALILAGTGSGILRSSDGGTSWSAASARIDSRIHDLLFPPDDPDIVYAAASNGVFRSIDRGATWREWSGGLERTGVYPTVYDVAPDAQRPGGLLAATDTGVYRIDEQQPRWQPIGDDDPPATITTLASAPSGAILAGTAHGAIVRDAGASGWRAIDRGIGAMHVRALATDPAEPATVLAGTIGDGIHRSTDHGRTWQRAAGAVLDAAEVIGLAFDPNDPSRAYALSRTTGLLVSADNGRTWSQTSLRREFQSQYVTAAIAFDRADPARVVIALDLVYQSFDRGETWSESIVWSDEFPCHGISAAAVDPLVPTILYVAEPGGVVRSVDGGATFPRPDSCGHTIFGGPAAFLVPASELGSVYLGGRAGVAQTVDQGESWHERNDGIEEQAVYALASDPIHPGTFYAGTDAGVSRTDSNALLWRPFANGLTHWPIHTIAATSDGSTLLAGSDGGGVQRFQHEQR